MEGPDVQLIIVINFVLKGLTNLDTNFNEFYDISNFDISMFLYLLHELKIIDVKFVRLESCGIFSHKDHSKFVGLYPNRKFHDYNIQ